MNIRYAFDYFSPTTLVAVINDQTNSAISPDSCQIVQSAYAALLSNCGEDKANEMLLDAGITHDDIEAFS